MSVNRSLRSKGKLNLGKQDNGAIIVFVTLLLVFLLAMMGLAFDIGHAYANKSQLQNIADASALAGASALNGTAAGIIEAEHRATDADGFLDNRIAFNTQVVPIIQAEVTYSVSLSGPWLNRAAAETSAPTIRFVRTRLLNRPSPVFFGKVIPGIPNILNLGVEAVAGQEPLTEVCRGLDPFSPAPIPGPGGETPGPPNYGYVPGEYYELRLAPGGSGGPSGQSCSDQGLPGCVTGNFGMADSGGCGPSTTCWTDTIINGSRDLCVDAGSNSLPTTPGDMGINVPRALQTRYDQDNDLVQYYGPDSSGSWSTDFQTYLSRTEQSGSGSPYRRIIRVAFNDGYIPSGHSGNYFIQGFGCFWMIVRPVAHPPSSAICLMFVGECDTSGRPTGTTPSITRIVLFR